MPLIVGGGGAAADIAGVAASYGPAAAAAIVSWRMGWLREWAVGIRRWRVPVRWWAVTLGLPLVFMAAYNVAFVVTGNDDVHLTLLPVLAVSYLPALVVMTLVSGMEEPGWRGFALPHLQERFSAVRASLVLGIVWAVWHIPFFALPEARHGLELEQLGIVMAGAMVEIVALAFLFTWLYNHTTSTLLCMLLHGGINAAAASLALSSDALMGSAYVQVALTINAVGILIVVALLALTRGRLESRSPSPDTTG